MGVEQAFLAHSPTLRCHYVYPKLCLVWLIPELTGVTQMT